MKLKSIYAWLLIAAVYATPIAAFEAFTVSRIKVVGLKRISKGAVSDNISFKSGQQITQAKAAKIIRQLFATGFFGNVKINQLNNNVLEIRVSERPSIGKLKITDTKRDKKIDKILREHNIAPGLQYSAANLSKATKALEWHYLRSGKYAVKINSKATKDTRNRVNLLLDIYEGDVAKVKKINFVGNNSFSENELRKQLHLAKSNWLSWLRKDDQYSKERLDAGLGNLRAFYLNRGYVGFKVDSSQVSLTPDKKQVFITINIAEGSKYSFGKVKLAGKFKVSRSSLEQQIAVIEPGTTFSRDTLLAVKESLQNVMGDAGYIFANAKPVPEIDDIKKLVHITYYLSPEKIHYVRNINIIGNTTTQDEVLRRELLQLEGAIASSSKIEEGKYNILRNGSAGDVDISIKPVNNTDEVDVTYKAVEQRLGELKLGFNYETTEKFSYTFGVAQPNFLGTGKEIDFEFNNSKSATSYSFGYFDPYYTIDGIGFGANAYHTKSTLSDAVAVSNFVTNSMGLGVNWSLRIAKYAHLRFGLGYDNTKLKYGKSSAKEVMDFVAKNGTKYQEFSTNIGLGYNTLDRRLFPTIGCSHNLDVKFVFPGQKLQYYKATYDMKWYKPIDNKRQYIFNIAATLGYGNGYGKTSALPFFKHFYSGNYVRGFEDSTLGPKDSLGKTFGGNILTALSARLIVPTPFSPNSRTIRTSLFVNAGQVHSKKVKFDDIRYSAGVSVVWNTPLGAPVVFSLAKPLNSKKGDEKQSFSFSLGTNF